MAGKHYTTAFPDSAWPRCGRLIILESISTEEEKISWDLSKISSEWWLERKKLKSEDFCLADATCNFFLLTDRNEQGCQFGINIRTNSSSSAEFDCDGCFSFRYLYGDIFKNIECEFKYETGDSHWIVRDFLLDSEIDKYFQTGLRIYCRISSKKSDIKETSSQAEMAHQNKSSALSASTQAQLPRNHAVAFPDTAWPRGGMLYNRFISAEEKEIHWYIESFLRECWSARQRLFAREESGNSLRELKSRDFPVANTSFHFFASFDIKESRSRFGVARTYIESDVAFDCFFNIYFRDINGHWTTKSIECILKGKCVASHWSAKEDFLSDSELEEFLRWGGKIDCILRIEETSKEACSQTEVHFSSDHFSSGNSVLEAHTQTQQFESLSTECSDFIWPCGGQLSSESISAKEEVVTWNVESFLNECCTSRKKPGIDKKMKSGDFSFFGGVLNLFISFYQEKTHSQFRINMRGHTSSDAGFDCCCNVSFKLHSSQIIKNVEYIFRCDSSESLWIVKNFFSENDLDKFLLYGTEIVCRITKKEVCSSKEVEAQTKSQQPKNNDDDHDDERRIAQRRHVTRRRKHSDFLGMAAA